jgi:hypothetical protein
MGLLGLCAQPGSGRKAKVTRDTTGNPGAGGARGPRRPSDRRRPPAAGQYTTGEPAEEDPWSTGLTTSQRAFPVRGGVPGYEFEGRRSPRRPPAGLSQPMPARPAGRRDEQQAWPRGGQAVPGFEFDAPARAADRWAPSPPSPRSPAPPHAEPPGSEWARLLRSFLPEPVTRNWFAEFRAALHFRGAVTRVIIPIMSMMVFGVAVVVIAGANGSHDGPAPPPAALGFPPATVAGADFSAADNGRGISQTLGRVTSDGAEIVAVGSQQGARIARAQFFVSTDDGRSWSMGHVRTPDGGPPPPGYAARFVAGGQGAWVAIGPRSIWASADGRTWTLSSTAGLPLRPGDQISVLARTAAGFIAAGSNVPGGNAAGATPVLFLSANGTTWLRLGAGQLHLAAGTGRVLGISGAAAYGNQILMVGDVTQAAGRTAATGAAWLSGNGGTTWTLAVPPGAPAGHGARGQISGEAVTADGFILFRPATVARRPAVAVFRSANGTTWTFEATLGTPAGFVAGLVNGTPGGAVITGQAGPALIAFVSADGASWRRTPAFGSAAARDVSGVAVAGGGTVVTAGTTTDEPDSRQPLLTVLGPQDPPQDVDISKIPGATDPELAVNDVAAGNGMQVAVGSANGYPAAWTSKSGASSWTRANGQTPAVLDRPGVQQLTSVAFGADGWLAVGGVIAVAAQHPVVLGSGNGSVWIAADRQAAFNQPGLFTEQAAAGPGTGYAIVGYQAAGGRTIAAAWWSAGLTSWHRAAVDVPGATPGALDGPGPPGQPESRAQMLAVTAGSRGFVAVGEAGDAPAAWTSTDGGRTWAEQNVPLPAGAARAVLQHVATSGRIVVAVGTALTTAGQQLPFAASSADGGATWTEYPLPVPAGHASVTALTATGAGGGFVATGTFGSTPGHLDVVVWTSAGGSSWKAATPGGQGLTGSGIQAITGLTVAGPFLSGVGFTATPGGEQPVLWQSPVR